MIAPLVARRKSFRRRNTSLARSIARERPAEGWSRAWAAKPSMGRSVSMNEDVSASGCRSQFHPPSGHCQRRSRSTRESARPSASPSSVRNPEGVPLLRGASTGPAPHHGHSFVPIGLGLRARHEFAEVVRLEPTFENPIPDRKEGLVHAGIAEIREGGEDPLSYLTLVQQL